MEELIRHPSQDSQRDLLKRYCARAESLIKQAGTREEARRIQDQLCHSLEQECASELIVHATRAYMDGMIRERWSDRTDGQDRTIDTH